MHTSPTRVTVAVLPLVLAGACQGARSEALGPLALSPNVVCSGTGPHDVLVRAEGLAPVVSSAATDTPAVQFPTVELVADDGTPVPVPLRYGPDGSILFTFDPTTVGPGKSLAVLTRTVDGSTYQTPGALTVADPPSLAALESDATSQAGACGTGDTVLTVTGTGIEQHGDALPSVILTRGDTDLSPLIANAVTGCDAGIDGVQHCTGLTVTLTAAVRAAVAGDGNVLLRVTNAGAAACPSEPLSVRLATGSAIATPAADRVATVCKTGGAVTLTGSGLAATGVMRIGNDSAPAMGQQCDASGVCLGMQATFGPLASAPGVYDVTVQLAGDCNVVSPAAVQVITSTITVASIARPRVNDDGGTLVATLAPLTNDTPVTSVSLLGPNNELVGLCGTVGRPACAAADANNGGRGTLSVPYPANILSMVTGQPRQATFKLVVAVGGQACPVVSGPLLTLVNN
jgi:hypothetical protein